MSIAANLTKSKDQSDRSEEYYKGVFTSLTSHIAVIDENGTILTTNRAWDDFSIKNGNTCLERTCTGANYFDVCEKAIALGDTIAGQAMKGIQSVLKKEQHFFELEYPCHSKDEQRWFIFQVMNFESDTRKVVTSHQDITKRKRAEADLNTSESNLKAIFENSLDGFILTDVNGILKSFNIRAKDFVFNSLENTIEVGKSIYNFIPESGKEEYRNQLAKVVSGEAITVDRCYNKEGKTSWLHWTMYPIYNQGKVEGVCISARDITRRKISETDLLESHQEMQAVFNASLDAIIIINEEGKILKWDSKAEILFGWKEAEVIGTVLFEHIIPHKLGSAHNAGMHHFLKTGDGPILGKTLEVRALKKNNTEFDISLSIQTSRTKNKHQFIGFIRDITERKTAVEKLKQSESRLKEAQKIAHFGSWERNFLTGSLTWSDEALRIHGLPLENNEVSFESWLSFIHPDDIELVIKTIKESEATLSNSAFFHRIVKPDGTIRHIHSQAHFEFNSDKKPIGLYGVLHDITEMKHAEEALQQSESNLQAVIENTDATIYSLDKNLQYITFNQRLRLTLKEAYGLDIKIGDEVYAFLEKLNPAEARSWEEVYSKALTGETVKFERHFNFNNVEIYTSFSIHPIWENKNVIGLSCYVLDITEQKQNEIQKEKLTADLIQRNKNLEQFSYIVSHNLRAPIANIMGLSSMLLTDDVEVDSKKEIMMGLSSSINELDEVIKDLNQILKIREEADESKQVISFSKIANEIQLSLQTIIEKEKAVVILNFSEVDEMLTIKSYLYNIFLNLISNSLTFRKPNISPVIEIKSKKQNNQIVLFFKDNGSGIDLEKKGDQIFGLYKRFHPDLDKVGSSRVDLQACKLEYSIVSPK